LAYRIGVATLSTPILYYPLLLTLYYPLPSTPYPLPLTLYYPRLPLTSTTPYLRADASAAPSRGERRTSPQSPGVPLAPRPSPRRPMTTREWRATRSRTALGAEATPFDKALILAVGLLQCLLQGRKSSKNFRQGSPRRRLVVLVRCEVASAAVWTLIAGSRGENSIPSHSCISCIVRALGGPAKSTGASCGRSSSMRAKTRSSTASVSSAGAPASGSACVYLPRDRALVRRPRRQRDKSLAW